MEGYNSTDTGDSDEKSLILGEPSSGRTRKHKKHSLCTCTRKLSKNECLCLVIGGIVLAVVAIVFSVVAVVSVNKTSSDDPWKNIRLPANIVPDHYEVSLSVDLESFNVTGEVTVNAEVVSETPYVLIHAKDMNITGARVSQGGSTVGIKSFNFTENEFYVIELSTTLKTGPLDIHITFKYTLKDDLAGFYRSSYTTQSGGKRWLATTQFESTAARKAFPCFDEPALKANFTIQITHDAQYEQVVSNMPVESRVSSSSDSNMVTTRFKTSVKMSTYLVAFIVSDFECVSGSTESGISVRMTLLSGSDNCIILVYVYPDHLWLVSGTRPKGKNGSVPHATSGRLITFLSVHMFQSILPRSSFRLYEGLVLETSLWWWVWPYCMLIFPLHIEQSGHVLITESTIVDEFWETSFPATCFIWCHRNFC